MSAIVIIFARLYYISIDIMKKYAKLKKKENIFDRTGSQ